ncbi:adhesion G protein-coupled receptor L2-like isoform X8 [Eriocheir sinensis]|uniref:adhesion G protein-coupled receptor L2-like isoform X8 n=1 Tax=Eriocheir sinensis TaxID=95602 RepID=UPI0021C61C1C|nr:adhesion G protein-coupled receptor L2-like isoform X8 [Eriocheir sinensis]
MDCDPGHVINLIRANYGRFSITICNEHGNTEWSVNCMSPRSHRVLHDKCSQRQNCSVAASTRGFGDPCPGTLKYLEAHFQCVPVNPPSHTARPRPPWFIATVSSITEDDPPLPSPPAKGGAAGAGVGTGTGVGGTQANDDRDAGDREIGGGRKEGAADDDDDSSLNLENRVNGTPIEDLPQTTTSTTTTLRPPPWLITNTTKNTTTSTTTTTTTTTTSTTAKPASSSTTTTAQPQTNLEAPSGSGGAAGEHGEGVSGDEASTSIGVKSPESPDSEQFPTSTVSTTTTWAPRAEVPSTGGGPVGSEASWCPPTSGRGLTWNWTQGGETAVQPCPGGASGWARRPCDSQGWAGAADLSECRSMWLSTLTSRAHTNDAVLAVAHDLASVTASRALYGGDVTATARLLNSLARRMANDVIDFPDVDQREAMVTELVNIAVATGSNLVGGQQAAWADLRPLEHRAAATSLLLGLEEAAFLLANNLHHEKTVRHAEANILLRLQVMETRNVESVTFPSAGEMWLTDKPTPSSDPASTPTGYGPFTTTGEQDASQPYPSEDILQDLDGETYKIPQDTITLPPEALLENSENGLVKMVFFSYDGLHHLLQPARRTYTPSEANFKGVNETRVLNSRVLSASLGAGRHIELSEPVVLTFAMLRTVNVTNPACVFWDYTTSSWSEEGCRVLRYNTSHTICQCDHLTNFAVLMDIHATPMSYPHHLALSIITYVGCVISIVCLLLATIVFHAFRGLKSDRTTIHKNLCVCLLIAETVFLAGINQTDKPVVCGVVAGLLHFFFLAAFVWMFMEGFQLYVMLVEVFEAEKPRARWYYAAAYGFPAVVVAVSAVVDPFSYGTTEVCWLRTDNYFIFAFVGPVIAVIIANSVFLSMSLFIMCRHANLSSSLKNKEHTKLASVRGRHENALFAKIKNHVTWVRGAVVFMFLLSLTWAFGLLYLNHASMVMAYVFTIFNSLQGIFIFIFHCIQNDKVKKELRRAGRRHPWLRACLCAAADRSQASKDTRSSSHNVGSHSQPNSHASHTVGTSSHDAHTCSTAQTAPAHAHPITCIQLPANLAALNSLHMSQIDPSALGDAGGNPCSLNTVFNLPTYPSSSSCDSTSSSTASPPDYQNALPFHIQQVNAAQIYSSPPPTPTLSQLYDSADPSLAAAALHQYIQPRNNALSLSPHLLTQQQAVSALSLNPTVLQAALSSLHSNNPKTLQAVDHHHYHNLLQLPLAAVHLAPDDNNYLQPKSHLTSTTLTSPNLQPASDTGPPPPPPLTTYTLNAMTTHLPPSTATVHHPIRQSLRDTQPTSPPTPSPSTSTPSTSKSKAPPRKPERPQMNSNNGVKEVLV